MSIEIDKYNLANIIFYYFLSNLEDEVSKEVKHKLHYVDFEIIQNGVNTNSYSVKYKFYFKNHWYSLKKIPYEIILSLNEEQLKHFNPSLNKLSDEFLDIYDVNLFSKK